MQASRHQSACLKGRAELPAGRRLFGHGEVIGFVVHLLAALPDARMTIDHVCAIPYVDVGHDVAIRWTLAGTTSADVVLVAGKGHESYQEVAGVRHPFDDLQVATQLLEARA